MDVRRLHRWLPELLMALALVALPLLCSALLGSVDLLTRILIWGIFGLGFDLLFGFTGLLSFGQAAFYGCGGFVTAYLLTSGDIRNGWLAIAAGVAVAAAFSVIVGLLALRRVGIYFAMITLAFGELAYFLENSPLARWTGGENGLPGVPAPRLQVGQFAYSFSGSWASYELIAAFFFVGFVFARFVVRSPVGAVLTAIRQNPLRTAALGHNVHAYKLSVFVLAAIFAGCSGALLGIFQGYMPPNAFELETSGQLVIQTVIGGAGTLIGPTIGAAIWLILRQLLQQVPAIGDLWLFILGLVFVALVTLLPKGIVGAAARLGLSLRLVRPEPVVASAVPGEKAAAGQALLAPLPTAGARAGKPAELALEVRNVSKAYGGIHAVEGVSLELPAGRFHAIIGPNGAGKSTFLRLLNCEERPDSGRILLNGIDVTAADVTRAHQHGLAKSFQINQLFPQLTVRQNLRIGALSHVRGALRLDVFRSADGFDKIELMMSALLERLGLTASADVRVSSLAYGEKRRLELGLALASRPSVLLLDEPLAGLSPGEREGIKHLIQDLRRGRTIVLVEHDMDAVFELAERITVLHEGRKLAEGTPQEISGDRRVREAYLGGIAA
ncbi:branched-chain amino acid ABC transporter ATP-binding protein/permease [Bradyrhizobium sp. ISRA443]|uniref:branched-chain amino acid ABC transporter ATP-binding protein/permease n=1 Tax=unclassified Bradyrhizobium TaxID=2631580 RepID=UPI0024786AED|nr:MULTISPECIES: branched-chain amino acid ABC transporter ATP-binding protein/permease [unclassified Bradyrhizobium]WGS01848.1 branched-chain amino acid ABC transporter ATP-binding protein/permease [Bradyrhizobium sp. ISRA436]WGS08734.1 branched-chain amino acid ABC transporter ATP-binding protein/permease [Bradyrhizobium sp. ISRA437]WGS15622.1 branched-chain amino acid ABC transporter ATP-binding protein/permease [Bradyrhizobium sp. ISRA443]